MHIKWVIRNVIRSHIHIVYLWINQWILLWSIIIICKPIMIWSITQQELIVFGVDSLILLSNLFIPASGSITLYWYCLRFHKIIAIWCCSVGRGRCRGSSSCKRLLVDVFVFRQCFRLHAWAQFLIKKSTFASSWVLALVNSDHRNLLGRIRITVRSKLNIKWISIITWSYGPWTILTMSLLTKLTIASLARFIFIKLPTLTSFNRIHSHWATPVFIKHIGITCLFAGFLVIW